MTSLGGRRSLLIKALILVLGGLLIWSLLDLYMKLKLFLTIVNIFI